MGEIAFDQAASFNEDYLWFYETPLNDERSRSDATEIIETLDLKPGASILDAPCGHGRIANILATDGYAVTGVDITELFIDKARNAASELGASVDYLVGDLRDLPVSSRFDAVICWFTSFGYFDDVGNREVLSQFSQVLRPGGQLLIETLHHDGFVRNHTPAPAATIVERGDDVLVDVTTFDPSSGRIETDRTINRDGQTRRSHHSIRLPTIPEFDSWLASAGFAERSYSDKGGEPLSCDSWRLVVTARK